MKLNPWLLAKDKEYPRHTVAYFLSFTVNLLLLMLILQLWPFTLIFKSWLFWLSYQDSSWIWCYCLFVLPPNLVTKVKYNCLETSQHWPVPLNLDWFQSVKRGASIRPVGLGHSVHPALCVSPAQKIQPTVNNHVIMPLNVGDSFTTLME